MSAPSAPLRVVKVGGRAQADASLVPAMIDAWEAAPGRLVLVHGGGDELSALMRAFGREPRFIGGRRVTDPEDLDLARMALSGSANKRLVSQLGAARAVGLSGEDGGLLLATLADGGAMGRVGRPTTADASLLRLLLDAGHLPVVSPLARAVEDGGAYNVNGDDAAAMLAAALGAAELLLVSDVPAVRAADGSAIASLDAEASRVLIADGTANGGMAAKLDAALAALARGVPVVRVGDVSMLTNAAAGTRVTAAPPTVP